MRTNAKESLISVNLGTKCTFLFIYTLTIRNGKPLKIIQFASWIQIVEGMWKKSLTLWLYVYWNTVESCLPSTHKYDGKCRQCEPCNTFLNAKGVHIIPGISLKHFSKFDECRLFYIIFIYVIRHVFWKKWHSALFAQIFLPGINTTSQFICISPVFHCTPYGLPQVSGCVIIQMFYI